MENLAKKFGTAPVFFTAISTILGAILFLRFGYSVGQIGFLGTVAIVLVGHLVTIPTAMALAEIATNQKVEGGGEYFIISRSFGLVIGSTIGIALYLSQAISVAFYVMAFSEAFTPFFNWIINSVELSQTIKNLLLTKQIVGIPALMVLTYIMLTKGASLGVRALYVIVAILTVSLIAFFLGTTDFAATHEFDAMRRVPPTEAVSFFTVFAIIFPAFTGMTAGVGLSGDLRNPGKSIPLGTLAATFTGMIIYIIIAYKLALSASPVDLANTDTLILSEIALFGWIIIPLGLAAATISSALGSIMVAPRTLQAIAKDRIFPVPKLNIWLSRGTGEQKEPYNASVITIVIASIFILLGAIDSVAKVISMFFMVTYGALCLISFLNHFAGDPSYRPRFKSKWYFSLFGFIACVVLMFFMNPVYAFISIVVIIGLYITINYYNQDKNSLAVIFQGVMFQFSRSLHVFLQKAKKEQNLGWRPSTVAISEDSFHRLGAFDLLGWISKKYGFGTYIHIIKGYLSKETHQHSQECKQRLIKMAEDNQSNIFIDTMVSPSYTSTIAQVVQLPGIAGTENNLFLFEYSKENPNNLKDILDNLKLIKSVNFDIILLASSIRGFGINRNIHIWITSSDYNNANLMILLGYILLGHQKWKNAEIKIFAIYPEDTIEKERQKLARLVDGGQLPISTGNITFISLKEHIKTSTIITKWSKDSDLTIVGFREELVKHRGHGFFLEFNEIGNVLFVNSAAEKPILIKS